MTTISINCPQCGRDIIGHLGQTIFNDRLVWNLGYGCQCGLRIEEDGYCEMPVEWRQEILKQEGRWALIIEPLSKRDLMETLKILRATLNLSLQEVDSLGKQIPGTIFSGTRVEMEFLRLKLRRGDIPSSVEKIDDSHAQQYPEFHCVNE